MGLDVSYHGRSTHDQDEAINKEYFDAYNKYKSTIRRGNNCHGHNNSNPDKEQLPFVARNIESSSSNLQPDEEQEKDKNTDESSKPT